MTLCFIVPTHSEYTNIHKIEVSTLHGLNPIVATRDVFDEKRTS